MEEKLDDGGEMSSNLPSSVDTESETPAVNASGKNQVEMSCKEGSEGGLVADVGEMFSDGTYELPLGVYTNKETPEENIGGENQVEVSSEEGSEGGSMTGVGEIMSNGVSNLPLGVGTKNETLEEKTGGENQVEVASEEGFEGGLVVGVGEILSDWVYEVVQSVNLKETLTESTRGVNEVDVSNKKGSGGGLMVEVGEILINAGSEFPPKNDTLEDNIGGENQVEVSCIEGSEGGLMAEVGVNVLSELPLSVNMQNGTLSGNTGSENQVEESCTNLVAEACKEGCVGELVIEGVGSDVFIDGFIDDKQGEFLSCGVEDFDLVDEVFIAIDGSADIYGGSKIDVEVKDVKEVIAAERNDLVDERKKSTTSDDVSETKGVDIEKESESANKIEQDQSSRKKRRLDEFAASDLVWGKVRSYPWWPGQIFDSSCASVMAAKHSKRNAHLVAYFANGTFAWNEAHLLKPFSVNFSLMEKQSCNLEIYQSAVNCALEEVSRRVELGLACSCIAKDEYDKIEAQVVENSGISEKSSMRYGVDRSSRVDSFKPEKLIEFVRSLAPRASSGYNQVDLVTALAQLSAFYRFKGYRSPNGSISVGNLLENDADDQKKKYQKEDKAKAKDKGVPGGKKSLKSPKKKRDIGDLTIRKLSMEKRKAVELKVDWSVKRVKVSAGKEPSIDQSLKPLFGIGECICKVARQLKARSPIVNYETRKVGSPKILVSSEISMKKRLFSQLQLLAKDPMKQHSFLDTLIPFFSNFWSGIPGFSRVEITDDGKTPEKLEFDYGNENGQREVAKSSKSRKRSETAKPSKFRKRSSSSDAMEADEDESVTKRKKKESSPTELVMIFSDRSAIPSKTILNKMFCQFGNLMECETEVDIDSCRARVIFHRACDAKAACVSAEKYNIFAPVQVNYQIGYSPLFSVKILPSELKEVAEFDVSVTVL